MYACIYKLSILYYEFYTYLYDEAMVLIHKI